MLFRSGDVDLEIRVPDAAAAGLAGLVLPGSQDPGAAELSRSRTLIHARIRPIGGVDIAVEPEAAKRQEEGSPHGGLQVRAVQRTHHTP